MNLNRHWEVARATAERSPANRLWPPDLCRGATVVFFLKSGALIGSPLTQELMAVFANPERTGAAETFVSMAVVYSCYMLFGAWLVLIPLAWGAGNSIQKSLPLFSVPNGVTVLRPASRAPLQTPR